MSNAKELLDANKAEYLNPTPDRVVDQKLLGMVSDFIVPKLTGERILELGAGDQVWTPKLLDRFPDVTTVEGSAELLHALQLQLAGRRWTPVCSLFEQYQPDQLFDTVLASYILEHVDDPSLIIKLARERWLKEKGRLAVVVPHALSLHRRLAVKMGIASYPGELGDTDHRMEHHWCFTCYDMEKLIVDAGFDVLEKKGLITKLLPNSLMVDCNDEQLKGMFELGLELPIEYSAAIYFLAEARPR
ncbi:MAG: class I SAM-dependent methyltransferase [Blastocatellia bacterium]|nr:class I SAM-dependent methyltransferase [Blastocatellia bacterium]